MTTIDEIKSRLDIVDLVTESVQLRKSGKNYTGFCPFHANVRTPAFVVFPDSGTWRCFGQCNEGGDIFKFVMKKEGWDFGETLRYLAERAGVQLKPTTPQEQAAAEEGDALRHLLEDAVTFYRHHLLSTPAGKPVLDYLRQKRRLTDETIEAFGLGYAPPGWDNVLKFFTAKGYTEKDLLDAGLLTERQSEPSTAEHASRSTYDRFRHRIMIPIRDERGRMAGFGARIFNPEDVPKFLNSPETAIFSKGRLLYGLDRARKAIRSTEQAVIVEGYLDVIALHQAGYANAVSPMGTALTEHQLYLLKKLTRRIVLALDPDTAGEQATMRGLQLARQALDRETEPVFDARGLLTHEARLQADLRVTTLPPGMDPDEVVDRDPKEWERILANAQPIVIHVMETLASGRDLDDPKVKTAIAAQVIPLIEEVPGAIERDTYRQRLARLLRVNEAALLGETRPRPGRGRARTRTSTERVVEGSILVAVTNQPLENHCLGVLMRRPELIYRVDRAMQQSGLARLSLDDFQRAELQTIFSLVQESLRQDDVEPLHYVLNRLSQPLADVADEVLARTARMDPNEERVLDDLVRALVDLRSRNLRRDVEHLRYLMEDAQQQGDRLASEYQQNMLQYTQIIHRLDIARGRYTDRTATH